MFQYVSIISVSTIPSRILFPRFTFQYVSIISQQCQKEAQFTAIYIPICFYYFCAPIFLVPLSIIFTFQYVFIISQSALPKDITVICIYIPILFRITNSIYATYNHNLHSNMFLLFQLLVEQGYTDFENLHSNMFLLFLTSNLIKSLLDFIYIPICFYYFQDEHIFIENGISFTFQYVSIISVQSQELLPM